MGKQTKTEIRAELKAKRGAIGAKEREEASQKLITHFQSCFSLAPGNVIAGYMPLSTEFDVLPLMISLHEKGFALCLPVVQARKPMVFKAWAPGDELEKTEFGIAEPLVSNAEVTPTHLLIPLLGYDAEGTRLGYGQGHYDITLEKLKKKNRVAAIGVGYSCQFYPDLPREPHDEKLDFMITEQGVTVL